MTARHRVNPAIAANSLQPHAVKMFTQSGLLQEPQMFYLHTACQLGRSCLLALMVLLTLSSSTSNAWSSETPHAADEHHKIMGDIILKLGQIHLLAYLWKTSKALQNCGEIWRSGHLLFFLCSCSCFQQLPGNPS